MKTIENLDGDINASGSFTEAYGVKVPLLWEHPDAANWRVQVQLGYGGVKAVQGTTEIAVTFDQLFAFLRAKEPNLMPSLPTPTAAPASGAAPQTVTLACGQAGAQIRYTLDGSTPTEASTLYEAPVTVATAATLKAKAFKAYWQASAAGSFTYA